MAKKAGRAGKRTRTAGRDRPRARKAAAPKAPKRASRKPKPAKSAARKQKPSPASETAQLKQQLKAALQQQTATAEVLRVISRSPGELGPVFKMVLENATRLCDARFGTVHRFDGKAFYFVADVGTPKALAEHMRRPGPLQIPQGGMLDRILKTRRLQHTHDYAADAVPGLGATLGGARSTLGVPILRDDALVGAIVIYRQEVRPFSDREIDMVRSFAAQAAIAIENARLFNETKEALERQTATADVLKVIASSPSDVQPVFEAIAASANRLIGAFSTAVHVVVDDIVHLKAYTRTDPESDAALEAAFPAHRREVPAVALVENGQTAQIPDSEMGDERTRRLARVRGWRSVTFVPLMNRGTFIGLIGCTRRETGLLADHHVQLLRTFADQAVIAVENTRLFKETQEALERQTATSDILAAINGSAGDPAPVFECILEKAHELCGAPCGSLQLYEDDRVVPVAIRGMTPAFTEFLRGGYPITEGVRAGLFADHPIQRPDMVEFQKHQPNELSLRAAVELGAIRTMASVPLLKDGVAFGRIVAARREVRPFDDKQIATLQGFAAQAVIAIENARLLQELRGRTDDLSESLQQQTATADVLKVISRSAFDLDSVMNTLAQSAAELCKVELSTLYLCEGDVLVARGIALADPTQADFLRRMPVPNDSSTYLGRTILTGAIRNIADVDDEKGTGRLKSFSEALRFKSILFVPLMREGRGAGVFALARARSGQFSQREVDLVQTFADQAVIAIENTRLFEEVRARTADLTESLQQQTATSEVLRVIAASPTDVKPVLDAIVESACQLCEASDAYIALKDRDDLVFQTHHGSIPVAWKRRPINRQWPAGRAVADRKPVHLRDVMAREGDEFPDGREIARRDGARSVLTVPLMREGESIGVIILRRTEVEPFTDKQIALLETFADQAVIAIENTRLFNETKEALERQTATADILKVIASSPSDAQPVFEAIASSARRLIGGFSTAVHTVIDDMVHLAAYTPTTPEADAILIAAHPRHRSQVPAVALIEKGETAQFADSETADEHTKQLGRARGWRSVNFTPLMNQGKFIGFIASTRRETGLLADHHVQLLRTFADQAVIAIENVRLFDQVQARTRELSRSLDDLRAAQDRLVQTEKLASLGQLTAGIAHEIKNPLNFVNNFAALSAELTDELKESLQPAVLDESLRAEVNELTGLLKDNLGKVVQHGRRADSIVKNMLLHSREGSGEHRPSDVNALVEESLNLAYHGARAEKPQFNVTIERDLDPEAGTIVAFPQEITRVLLNLISNGFHAVSKRKTENANGGFDPVVKATTRGLPGHVEIRIRDNGTGIPPEVKEKMFNPFFTTKPAGEGTGLGLSMSHDIVVKQHGGTIDVETVPGEFTEFTIRLPRASNFTDNDRGWA